jgi:hypothetical protein
MDRLRWFPVIIIAAVTSQFAYCDVVVTTKYGKIKGINSTKTNAFLGVPYAAPPVGKLR